MCDSRGTGELCAPLWDRARHDFSLAWLEAERDLSQGVNWHKTHWTRVQERLRNTVLQYASSEFEGTLTVYWKGVYKELPGCIVQTLSFGSFLF